MKRFPRLRILLAISAMVVVSMLALAAVPDAVAKPCPPPSPPDQCPNCAPSLHGCPLVQCENCGRTICEYGC